MKTTKLLLLLVPIMALTSCHESQRIYSRYEDYEHHMIGLDHYTITMSPTQYEMSASIHFSSDNEPFVYLSEGHYKRKGNKYYFYDDDFGFQMVFRRNKKDLIAEQSFPYLIGQEFRFLLKTNICLPMTDEDGRAKCKIWQQPLVNDTVSVNFRTGVYQNRYDARNVMEIGEDGGYRYYLFNHLLSEGTWTREANFLTLQDTLMHYRIEATIMDSTLVTKAIPADCNENLTFVYVGEKPSR